MVYFHSCLLIHCDMALFIMLMSDVATDGDYYIIIVALWSYAYMIIHMHICAFHMKLMASHRHRAVTIVPVHGVA